MIRKTPVTLTQYIFQITAESMECVFIAQGEELAKIAGYDTAEQEQYTKKRLYS